MNFRLLPEWAEQDAVMLTWPHKDTDWADNLARVEPVYI
ncbi:MAG: agmatine deiminase family protein, partial [Pseudoalteromonas sp.]